MLSALISIPALILLGVLVYSYFIDDEDKLQEFNELFLLDTKVVQIFITTVIVSVIAWVIGLILPISALVSLLNLVENVVAIIWLAKAMYSGKSSIWLELLKNKITSIKK